MNKMIRFIVPKLKTGSGILAILLLFFILPAGACKGTKAAQQASPSDRLPQALLWKIGRQDLAAPSYLFGTIHMIPQEDYFLPAGFDDAFARCEEVVFEIDMDEMSDMSSLIGLMANILMKDGVTLKALLRPEEYREVSAYFDDMGIPMLLLNRVKPMFLSMLAEVNMVQAPAEQSHIMSYEMELFDKANLASKETGGLETMNYQLSLFDSIPYSEQAYMLLDAVRGTSVESDMLDETVALYKRQDIEAMVTMISESETGDDARFESILLRNRNHNWIPLMEKMMKGRPVFFAVGAGHLGGEEGVIRLLRKQGFTVTPVSVYKSK